MKKLALLFTAVFLIGTSVNARTTNTTKNNSYKNGYSKGYTNSFIFTEGGIEFSVFPDGQFDFYAPNYGPKSNMTINTPNVSFSFNTGYDYGPYVQYDDYGAIIQIENTPIYYDYYGRITQAGHVNIHYNNYGRVSRVGSLHVYYDHHQRFTHYTGYINVYNRVYVPRPWHYYYTVPAVHYRVVYAKPYRQYYTPVRHPYYRPYANNYREPVTYIPRGEASFSSGRRNTVATNSRVSDRYRQEAVPRRSTAATSRTNSNSVGTSARNASASRKSETTRTSRNSSQTDMRNATERSTRQNTSVRSVQNSRLSSPAPTSNSPRSSATNDNDRNIRTRSTTGAVQGSNRKISTPARNEALKSAPSRTSRANNVDRSSVQGRPNTSPTRTYNVERNTSSPTRAAQSNPRTDTGAKRQSLPSRSNSAQSRGN